MSFGDTVEDDGNSDVGAVSNGNSSTDQLIEELVKIGIEDGFISEKPGGKFNGSMRHIRAIEIGEILHSRGNFDLMLESFKLVRIKVDPEKMMGLRFAWQGIGGQWDPYYVTTLL